MTTRQAAYLVTLAQDIREDDADATITALKMVKGVIDVAPVEADWALQVAQTRVDREWQQKIWEFAEQSRRQAR